MMPLEHAPDCTPPTTFRTYLAFDPNAGDEGQEFLITVWDDGSMQVAHRPGRESRWMRWSPPVTATEVSE